MPVSKEHQDKINEAIGYMLDERDAAMAKKYEAAVQKVTQCAAECEKADEIFETAKDRIEAEFQSALQDANGDDDFKRLAAKRDAAIRSEIDIRRKATLAYQDAVAACRAIETETQKLGREAKDCMECLYAHPEYVADEARLDAFLATRRKKRLEQQLADAEAAVEYIKAQIKEHG